MAAQYVFHLIGTAHIDPVWFCDWREGLNEGLATCRGILNLLDEDTELCFCRGEAAIYQHIESWHLYVTANGLAAKPCCATKLVC